MIGITAAPVATFVIDLKFARVLVEKAVTGTMSSARSFVMRPISITVASNAVFPQPAVPRFAD